MNKIKTCLLILSAMLMLTTTHAQTADEIISKHIDALGGKDKLSQINTVYIESTTSVMGTDSPSKTYIVSGKGYRSESDFNGQSFVNVITDSSGWMINPYAGATDPTAIPDEQFKANADEVFIDPLFNYAVNGAKVELAGQEKVGDINAYKLKYTNKYGSESYLYIDPATWYIIQLTKTANAMGQQVIVTITFSNYQKTDFGNYMPYATHIDMGQFVLDINTKTVTVNKDIDPGVFKMSK